jgi:hypothetical protein
VYIGLKTSVGEVACLKHDEETDTWVTSVKWGVGTSKKDVKLTGSDILVRKVLSGG